MEIKNVTVLGSGIMGHGIAQISAMAGYNVVLRDIEQQFLDKAIEKIKWSLDKLVSKEKISGEQRNDIFSRIKPIVDLNNAVRDSDLVIEAVPEIMDLKKKVYAELDKLLTIRLFLHLILVHYQLQKLQIQFLDRINLLEYTFSIHLS